ncbi:hypothetical protein CBR65_03525 [Cellvibrio sp. PSBB006]|nr:hypothetical protein CBR65_03525 [Cellvibrio sp. PSBB006]
MKTLLTFVLAGILNSSITAYALDVTETKGLAYYISEFEVTDTEGIKPYSAQVTASFQPYGGRYMVRGGKITSLEGKQDKRMVIIAFDSLEQAKAWYYSERYQSLIPIRQKSATATVYFVEGVSLPLNTQNSH